MKLEDACNKDDHREFCRQPFNYKGKGIATNGQMLIVSEPNPEYMNISYFGQEAPRTEVLDELLSQLETTQFKQPLPELELPKKNPCFVCKQTGKATVNQCKECDGSGEITLESDYNDYEVECKSCGGDGEIARPGGDEDCPYCDGEGSYYRTYQSMNIGKQRLAVRYVDRLVNHQQSINIYPDSENHRLFFSDGSIKGVIMAMVSPHERR
jgi:hypothetical protein